MNRVVLTARVENPAAWENGFRSHGDLFRSQSVKAIHFSVDDSSNVALYLEVEDLDKYMEIMRSPATAEAMAHDGVHQDTVQIFILDKEFAL